MTLRNLELSPNDCTLHFYHPIYQYDLYMNALNLQLLGLLTSGRACARC